MTQCTQQATTKQQMTHAARLRHITAHDPSQPAERYLCDEHADLIDRDWITVEVVNPGDVASVLAWANRQCEYIEDTREFDLSALCVHGIPRKYCDGC